MICVVQKVYNFFIIIGKMSENSFLLMRTKMLYISGMFFVNGGMNWHVLNREREENGLTLSFTIHGNKRERQALTSLRDLLKRENITWISPVRNVIREWLLDLDSMKLNSEINESFGEEFEWLHGQVTVFPEHEKFDRTRMIDDTVMPHFESSLQFVITEEEMEEVMVLVEFPELLTYVTAFQNDNPDSSKCAFVMMKYQETDLHKACLEIVREICGKHGIAALRADDKRYSDDLLHNIRTYMHGCGFGISIFERLIQDEFNPNVSLEVGYMMALGKPVCLLKDKTLDSLQTDLIGRLYEPFDTQNPADTIPPVLEKWLGDKGLI